MSYVIAGRVIKNEYIALSTLGSVFGIAFLATRGGSKKPEPKPTLTQKVKEAVSSGNSEEEEFIRKFVEEAERESKH